MLNQFVRSSVAIGILMIVSNQSDAGDEDKKLIHEAMTSLSTMIASIETMECKIESKITKDGKTSISSAKYVRKGNHEVTRIKALNRSDFIVSQIDDTLYELMSSPIEEKNQPSLASIHRMALMNDNAAGLDPWYLIGFRDHVTMMQIVSKKPEKDRYTGGKAEIRRTDAESHDGIRVIGETESCKEIWDFDKTYNCLRIFSQFDNKDNNISNFDYTLRNVKEVKPGIYIPHEVEKRFINFKGEIVEKTVWTLSDVKVNHKVADEAVAFTFPKGTRVQDFIKGVEYTAGADGKPDGPVREMPKVVAPGK
jgi:hypothetical protein